MSDESDNTRFSRRKLLGSVATVGGAGALGGAATSALLWDEEKFGNETNPNVLQGGELDLKVDWEGQYYDWIDNPTFSSENYSAANQTTGEVDQPGPIFPGVEGEAEDGAQLFLNDIKPGDVLEVTLSAHVYGNPAFLGMHYTEHIDSDNGISEPEDMVNGEDDGSDGTSGGDLDDHMNYLIWYDDGDNVPQESYTGDLDLSTDSDGNFTEISEEEYVMEIAAAQDPGDIFDDNASTLNMGVLDELDGSQFVLDSQVSNSGEPANDFPDSQCYQNSVTEYIGVLAWVPRDIPGVNDNIIQTDKLGFQFGFEAIQCRHNVDENGTPINDTIGGADAENNANSPSGNTST